MYNDGIFDYIKDKKSAPETRLYLEHGKPLIFGAENEKGIRFNNKTLSLEVGTIGEEGFTEEDLVVHDETNKVLAQMLAGLRSPDFPEAIGVLYCDDAPSYTDDVYEQRIVVREKKGVADINALLRTGHTWTVS